MGTSAGIMPIVDGSVALVLLQQALTHSEAALEDDSLRKRCVKALAPNWKTFLQVNETGEPAAKRPRTSDGECVDNIELPLDVKLELATTALLNGESLIAQANL